MKEVQRTKSEEMLTENQKMVMAELARCGPRSPTEIGVACGKSETVASSWACRALQRLEKLGLVVGVPDRGRKRYHLTDAGNVKKGLSNP